MPSLAAFTLACASGQVREGRVLTIRAADHFTVVYDGPLDRPRELYLYGAKVLRPEITRGPDHDTAVEALSYVNHRFGDVRGRAVFCLHGEHDADVLVDGGDLASELVDLQMANQTVAP